MYTPSAFRNDDRHAAYDFIDSCGFAALVTAEAGETLITHLPMTVDRERGALLGHMARANPHASRIEGRRCTAVFLGPNAYVSPDWYDDATQVPTWNYIAAHVEGIGRPIEDPAEVDAVLSGLSNIHEHRRRDLDTGKLWRLEKLPAEKLRRMRAAIVVFEIIADRIELKEKLSQNKSAGERERIRLKLASGGEMQQAVAAAMSVVKRPS